jgi:antitoxin component YwqK of YwqJK toxin-antitoxin module
MKILFIFLIFPTVIFSQVKDTIEQNQLSLFFNSKNRLYKVIDRKSGKIFQGWGKFRSDDNIEYRYYYNNELQYTDYRDFNNNIIKRELINKNTDKYLEQIEYYNNNLSLIKKKYFICIDTDHAGDLIERKCGKYREYYENGNLKIKGDYNNDKAVGVWMHYDLNGKIVKKE